MIKTRPEFNTARDFLTSTRGQYIVGQALHIAIEKLELVKGVHREVSNIDDMKFIRDEIYPIYTVIQSEYKPKF